jgi:hypothetical protein
MGCLFKVGIGGVWGFGRGLGVGGSGLGRGWSELYKNNPIKK